MKNPLNKRFIRELKSDFGKYIAIFLFLVFFVGAMSGFMVADNSVTESYNESLIEHNVEDGHLAFNIMPSDTVLKEIENDNGLTFYNLYYKEETVEETSNIIRIYKDRDEVNTEDVLSGKMPSAENEIAIDRLYAQNNNLSIGDTITVKGNKYIITGFFAVPDYSCLFENNSDMIFDAVNFSIAVVSEEGYNLISNAHQTYNYAYKYKTQIEDDTDANARSEKLINSLEDIIKEYDTPIIQTQVDKLYDKAGVYGKPLVDEIKSVLLQYCNAYSISSSQTAKNLGISEEKYTALIKTLEDIENRAKADGISFDDETANIASIAEFKKYINNINFDNFKTDEINIDDYNNESAFNDDFDKTYNYIVEIVDAIQNSGIYNCSNIYKNLQGVKSVIDNAKIDDSEILNVNDYNPKYTNKAINFVIEDSESDGATVMLMMYIIMAIVAFLFAVTTSNTITKEATSIGTLRASGYSSGELIRHYMVLPIAITVLGELIGNVFGYLVFQNFFVKVYYNNYSLTEYKTLWNFDAFLDTSVVPLIIIVLINFIVLAKKLKISPLNLLRGEVKKKGKKGVVHLSKRLPLMSKFRLRILLQNIPSYLTMFVGIVLAGMLLVLGIMFGPLLSDYSDLIKESQICSYQYILIDETETTNENAEKYCVTSLETMDTKYIADEATVYGINSNSKYITKTIPKGKVLISNAMMDKFNIDIGDEITLKEPYGNDVYTFVVAGDYKYDSGISVFMARSDYLAMFNKDSSYFTGYFSNEELTDIDKDNIATVITDEDLTKMVTQMTSSMLGFMDVYKVLGIVIFLLLMFILTKQIIDKNNKSISMTKILGFTDVEIGRLYLVITSFVVIASLLIAIPFIDVLLRWMFHSYLYTEMTGYVPYIVDKTCYIKMVVLGIISYAVVATGMMFKIKRTPKGEALKNQSL